MDLHTSSVMPGFFWPTKKTDQYQINLIYWPENGTKNRLAVFWPWILFTPRLAALASDEIHTCGGVVLAALVNAHYICTVEIYRTTQETTGLVFQLVLKKQRGGFEALVSAGQSWTPWQSCFETPQQTNKTPKMFSISTKQIKLHNSTIRRNWSEKMTELSWDDCTYIRVQTQLCTAIPLSVFHQKAAKLFHTRFWRDLYGKSVF